MKLSLAALALFVLLVPVHTQDGPNHRQVAAISARLDHSPVEAAIYRSTLGPLQTNSLYTLGYRAVAPAGITPRTYERLFFGAWLALFLLGYRAFLRVWSPSLANLWPWALPLLLHALFTTGMYNFVAACALTFWALVPLHRAVHHRSWPHAALFALACWAALLAHPFPFLVLPLAWLALARDARAARWQWLASGVVLGAFTVLALVRPALAHSAIAPEPYRWTPPLELVAGLTYYDFEAFSLPHLVLVAALMIGVCVLAMTIVMRGGWRTSLPFLLMLLGYAVFPNEGHGGAHMNERFLLFAWAFLPLAIRADDARLQRAVRTGGIAMALLLAMCFAFGMRNVDRRVEAARTVLAQLPDGARLYPIQFQPYGDSYTQARALHLWAEYPETCVVHSPYLFAFLDVMPLVRRRPASRSWFPSAPENLAQRIAERAADTQWSEIARAAAYYDYWFVDSPPPRYETLLEHTPGLVRVAAVGRSTLWRNAAALPFDPAIQR